MSWFDVRYASDPGAIGLAVEDARVGIRVPALGIDGPKAMLPAIMSRGS